MTAPRAPFRQEGSTPPPPGSGHLRHEGPASPGPGLTGEQLVPPGLGPLVFGALACLASALDAWAAGGATPFTVAMAASLGAGLGLPMGALAGLAVWGARRLPPLGVWGGLPAAGAGAGMLWADGLGAFMHLGAGHVALGALTLLFGALAGAACGLVPGLLAVTPRFPAGPALARGDRLPASVLAIVAAALMGVERRLLPPFYPAAHDGAVVLALAAASIAVWLVTRGRGPLRRPGRRSVRIAALAVTIVPLVGAAYVGLDDARYVEASALLPRPLAGIALRFGRAVTDVDGDGFSSLLAGGDCAPLERAVRPMAREIPDNGVDDNCVAGDARASARVTAPPVTRAPKPSPRSVVLVTIDTLRPGRTTAYDPGVPTTPHLARWASRALRFDRAYTSGMSTNIAIPSMLTGMYARRLRWTRAFGSPAQEAMRERLGAQASAIGNHGHTFPLDDRAPLLAERLAARGMRTAAVVDDGRTFLLRRETIGRGFEEVHEIDRYAEGASPDVDTVRAAVSTLERLVAASQPFFLWVHVYGPHEQPADPDTASGAPAREYDRAVAETDRAMAPLFDGLDRADQQVPLATFVTADHGEALLFWIRGHGGDLYGGVPRVPFLVRAPGVQAGSTPVVASLVDLVPTVLALTETPGTAGFDGRDLSGVLLGHAPPELAQGRIVLADAWIAMVQGRAFRAHAAGAIDGQHALALDLLLGGRRLFDLSDEDVPPRDRITEVDPGRLEHALLDYLENTAGEPALP